MKIPVCDKCSKQYFVNGRNEWIPVCSCKPRAAVSKEKS